MITRISGVIRPKGSDLIFDHPYNADYGPRTAVSAARLGARRSPNSAGATWQRSDDHEGFARDPGSAAG